MSRKTVYAFGGGSADGTAELKNLLGGKGANLAEMARLGLPVPPGFTITTEVCNAYVESGGNYPDGFREDVERAIAQLEQAMGKSFGGGSSGSPLLVSVRSGARVSMPGMMDTVLNLGLNDETVRALAEASGNERFAYDSYRRFLAMYGDVVLQVRQQTRSDHEPFDEILHNLKSERGVAHDTDLTADDLKQLVDSYKALVRERTGKNFPDEPIDQLWGAIGAVFESWDNPRAIEYRRMYQIPHGWGTGVNVQAMVYGNLGDDCATGVAFTRDPADGSKRVFGEYLINAQGEDVVAGIRTPQPISEQQKLSTGEVSLESLMPEAFTQLVDIGERLEQHYRDMQDVEFTIERGELFMLQTRGGKRTGVAAIRIATDQVDEGLIDERTAVTRVEADAMEHLLAPVFSQDAINAAKRDELNLATGLPAGPGAATGQVVFHAADAKRWNQLGRRVILVRVETSPEDVGGMEAAQGILTSRGGMTSHAALVARQRGKPCIVGAALVNIDAKNGRMKIGDRVIEEGDWVSIDGTHGVVYLGQMSTYPSEVEEVFVERLRRVEDSEIAQRYQRVLEWADRFRKLRVRTNADSPKDARAAVALGAEGIGLCRTEHMFFEGGRISTVRRMIMASDAETRRKVLAEILPMQRADFVGIFRAMNGRPVTIRALDPPLHEFLPHDDEGIELLAKDLSMNPDAVRARVENLRESNPMLGHRGCRLGMVYPEITEMQARAILEAAIEVKRSGIEVKPEIMIPLVGLESELERQRALVEEVAESVFEERSYRLDYEIGTMIELPRAALTADRIARFADFFSYGTNDLTQTTFGISRDDAGVFLPYYIEHGLLDADPFQMLDRDGVGELVRIGVEKGRATKTGLKIGICGEHGGDPTSIVFAHDIGLDYVSCSPRRVPVARVAAAQAAIERAEAR